MLRTQAQPNNNTTYILLNHALNSAHFNMNVSSSTSGTLNKKLSIDRPVSTNLVWSECPVSQGLDTPISQSVVKGTRTSTDLVQVLTTFAQVAGDAESFCVDFDGYF